MSHNLNYEWRGMEPVSWNNDLDGWQIVEEQKTLHDWSKAPDWAEYAYRDAISDTVIWSRGTWKLQPGHKPAWMKDVEKRPNECRRVTSDTDDALSTQEGGDHYKKMVIQPVEYIHANGIGFIEGSVIKYVSRWRDKGGVQDLKKARHFLDLLMELEAKK